MLFTEPLFLFLFLPVLLGLYFLPFTGHRNMLLLVASVIFYASGGGSFVLLMAASIAFNYLLAMLIGRAGRTPKAKLYLALGVAANLIVLGWFKYANFFADNFNAAAQALGMRPWTLAHVALPIGISFFTFHGVSYVVDVYRGDATAQKSPVHAALYLLLFPQLIAGPIIRYREIADQLASRVVTLPLFASGVRRFIVGLGKKVLIANVVAAPADRIFGLGTGQLSPSLAWIGAVCYTLQIYFDFSGYSDMAIGLAAMFGFRFPQNFNSPYVARSVQEFWRRWHISLSNWFRDYLYVPLGGNRTSPARTYVNLVTVFFLCGLWHGASWTFVVWGLFHGTFLVAERLGLGRWMARRPSIVRHAYALLAVVVGWVLFRADTFRGAVGFLAAMAGRHAVETAPYTPAAFLVPSVLTAIAAGVICSVPLESWRATLHRLVPAGPVLDTETAGTALAGTVALTAVLAMSILMLSAHSYSPFIYFRF